MRCESCDSNFRTINTPKDEDRVCYKCGFNNGKERDELKVDTEIKKVSYKGEFKTNIKEKLSPEFDDLIKTLQFPDKFYDILDRVIKREVQETKEKINKIIEEWYLEHRKKGDGIGKLYEELKLKLEEF